jgi:hypothetical protein
MIFNLSNGETTVRETAPAAAPPRKAAEAKWVVRAALVGLAGSVEVIGVERGTVDADVPSKRS